MPRQFKILLVEKIDEAGLKLLESVGEVKLASGASEETLMEEVVKFFALKQSAKDINPLNLSPFRCEK